MSDSFNTMRRYFLFVFVVVAIVISIIMLRAWYVNGNPASLSISRQVVKVLASDQTCVVDEDCTTVSTICSSCECGEPVNIKMKQKYSNLWQNQCKDYSGGVCDFSCNKSVWCLDNKCVLAR